jgi:hypothetical protein
MPFLMWAALNGLGHEMNIFCKWFLQFHATLLLKKYKKLASFEITNLEILSVTHFKAAILTLKCIRKTPLILYCMDFILIAARDKEI